MNNFNKNLAHLLHRLEKRSNDEKLAYLIFPTRNDMKEHWLTFKLDFRSDAMSYHMLGK